MGSLKFEIVYVYGEIVKIANRINHLQYFYCPTFQKVFVNILCRQTENNSIGQLLAQQHLTFPLAHSVAWNGI